MTKRPNKGSNNQNSPQSGNQLEEFSSEQIPGDNSKGNKRNQKSKTNKQN
ncbi:hypothetical protein ACOI1C_17040 [Bacillus sp. DJP31]